MKQHIYPANTLERSRNTEIFNILLIIFVWLAMTILVNPLGDFPLNDDWAYAESVKHFLETGTFQLPGWAVANLLPQVFIGVLFCLPFGFSFTALRFSTLTLGLLGILATYWLLTEISSNQKIALLGAFLVAFNPIYFGLSNTFMTDIPHYTVSVLSLYLFCVGLRENSFKIIVLSLVTALIALLIRQVTVALFVGYTFAYILKYRVKIQVLLKAALLFIILPIVTQSVFKQLFWPTDFGSYGVKEEKFVSQLTSFNLELTSNFIYFCLCALLYLGCFLLPFLILIFNHKLTATRSRLTKNILIISCLFLITIIATWLILNKVRMPIIGNVLDEWGLAPLTLRDTLLSTLSSQPESFPNYIEFFWIMVTCCSIIGAALLIVLITVSAIQFFFDSEISSLKRSQTMVNTSTAFVYFLPLGMNFFFDRYLLFLLPLLMGIILCFLPENHQLKINLKTIYSSLILIAILSILTIASTHDYLSWNRIRWQAINNVMEEKGIDPKYIDGGFEFNGWYLYNPRYDTREKRKSKQVWWWVERDDYVISFSPLEGYQAIEQYWLKNWLPFKTNSILLLEKKHHSDSF